VLEVWKAVVAVQNCDPVKTLQKRLAFLLDKCDTYIERSIGLDRAIAAIKREQRKRFKEWVGWQKEIEAIREELKRFKEEE